MSVGLVTRFAAFLAPVVLLTSPAFADDAAAFPPCTTKASAADIEGAKGAHRAATQFFERGEYDRAITYWNDAFKFDCSKAVLLLNLASAYEKKGQREPAVSALKTYLERSPNAPDAAVIQERVKNLEAAIEAEKVVTPPPVEEPPPPVEEPEPPPSSEVTMKRPYGVTPLVVAGVGGAFAIAGGVLIGVGYGDRASVAAACAGGQCVDSDGRTAVENASIHNGARTKIIIGDVALGVGIAGLASGLVWQFVFNKEQPVETTPAVSLVPVVGPSLSGASLFGTF